MAGRGSEMRRHASVPHWPLVGRAAELTRLGDLLTGPDVRAVVLAGPAGVGKTRLGHECLLVAERSGLTTAQATATRSAAQLPFGAVMSVLREVSPDGAADDPVELLRRSTAALHEGSNGRRLVLFVDDAHLLDDASATLVHQVAATGSAIVVAAVRTGEPAPDPVVALWKDGLAERIEVTALGTEAIGELLAAVLDGPVDPATVVQFTQRSQGNALLLRELVIGALDDGSLESDGGLWRLTGQLSPSARLVEIVDARLGRFDDDERALMELVAYGEPLGHAELAVLSDPVLAEGLERRGLLASRVDGRRLQVHLAHPIYGDVLRARTPALRARAIGRSLADAVETTHGHRHEDTLQVATWRVLGGGGGDPEALLEAATIARWRYDFPLAERLARAAADVGAGFDATLLAAHVTCLQGRGAEAEVELAALATEAADAAQRSLVAIARFDNHGGPTGPDARRLLDEAASTVADPDGHDRLQARRLSLLLAAQGPRAAALAAQSLATHVDGDALVYTCLVGAYSLARLGRLDAAIEMSERGRTARRALDTPLAWYPWWHAVTSCVALRYAGRFAEAERIIAASYREALADGSVEAQAAFAVLDAEGVGERGRVRSAACRAREALAVHQQLGCPAVARQGHRAGALAYALGGQADEAADELRALDDLRRPGGLLDEVDLLQARAWTAAAGGDLARARHQLERAVAVGHEIGDVVGEAAALHGLARMGQARQVCGRLGEVAAEIDGDLAPARAAHARALAEGDAAALDQVSHDFEAMGAELLAAEAAADAAVALRRAGELREAAGAERRAAMLAERCENPVTPALQAVDVRAQLTPAERETAALAAAGRTNKEIARRLYLSSRTIENRLQRVYVKLGISGRAELTDVLVANG